MSKCSVEGEVAKSGVVCRLANKPATIASRNALLWGVAWLIISTIGGWYFCLTPEGVVGYDVVGLLPLYWHLMLNAVVWIIPASLLYVVILFHNREAKVVESYGRLLFAHWPAVLLILPVTVVGKLKYAMFSNDFMALLHSDALTVVLMALFSIAIAVWMLYWSYSAFRHLAGHQNWATWSSFIVGYYLASKLCGWVLEAIYQGAVIG